MPDHPVIQLKYNSDDVEMGAAVSMVKLLDILHTAMSKLSDPNTPLPFDLAEKYVWLQEATTVLDKMKEDAGQAAREAFLGVFMSREAKDIVKDIRDRLPICQ